jgi:hypothetical protein
MVEKYAIKYTNIFHYIPLQNITELEFSICKYTIWQPCPGNKNKKEYNERKGVEQMYLGALR